MLKLVQRIALGLNSWHLTMSILSKPKREGGLAHAPLAAYTQWVHTQSFVTVVCKPDVCDKGHVTAFQKWAYTMGLVLDEVTLP